MFNSLWITLAVIYGISQADVGVARRYGDNTILGTNYFDRHPAFIAASWKKDGGSRIHPCDADRNRKPKKATLIKKKPKKPHIAGRGKVTITQEQKEQLEQAYKAHIAITDTPAYVENLALNTHVEESSPYLTLFKSEKLERGDLVGLDMPFGLVPPERYELWKLCGRVCDPMAPISSQSMTPKMFTQRLFRKSQQLTRDEFNHNIEYKMRFYAPGYGDIFFMDKVRCWRAWFLFRGYTEGREEMPTYRSIHQIRRPDNEKPLSEAIISVNYEVHRQGVHPAVLDMFWEFFTDNPSLVKRDEVMSKLNWVVDRLKNLEQGEGISPDNFYKIFIEPTKKALAGFDKEKFVREQLRKMDQRNIKQMVLSNNRALRQRSKILTSAYLEEIRSLYKTPKPEFYKQYERRRLRGYFNLVADMQERKMRRKAMSKEKLMELKAASAMAPVKKKKKKREKKPSKRNKKLGRGVIN
ncbi:hypothetical protein BaOVIS_011580 [Babesia ovis]|uniref:Uncharacterized protein n=1 Tax=Babesia ovis TaxID=5869 RepID=A0A9W5TDI9_BABOV|nr:hypothetical protein BaOVIS_011580 [Babesia ovis]